MEANAHKPPLHARFSPTVRIRIWPVAQPEAQLRSGVVSLATVLCRHATLLSICVTRQRTAAREEWGRVFKFR